MTMAAPWHAGRGPCGRPSRRDLSGGCTQVMPSGVTMEEVPPLHTKATRARRGSRCSRGQAHVAEVCLPALPLPPGPCGDVGVPLHTASAVLRRRPLESLRHPEDSPPWARAVLPPSLRSRPAPGCTLRGSRRSPSSRPVGARRGRWCWDASSGQRPGRGSSALPLTLDGPRVQTTCAGGAEGTSPRALQVPGPSSLSW